MKLAIDLGGTNIRIGQVENGTILQKCNISCPSQEPEGVVLEEICGLIDTMMNKRVTGIGIGVPSVVDAQKGIVYDVVNIPSWKSVPLKQYLESRFKIPVAVNNDANCFALGEKRFGLGQDYKNMVGITLGTGVGAGIIIDGKLYGGRNTGAGELAATPYRNADYEFYCCGKFFTEKYGITGKEAAFQASQGEPLAQAVWREFGTHLGKLLQLYILAYDPDAIVIGGGIAKAGPYYKEAMMESLYHKFLFPKSLENIYIGFSELADVSLLGASALLSEK